jgi:hypothetical protein
MRLPGRKALIACLFFVFCFLFFVSPIRAAWIYPDPEVTEVGRNADRARQLLFWLFSHPTLDNSPAIAGMWAICRNIVLILFVLLLVFTGLALILSRTKGGVGEIFSGIASPLYGMNLASLGFKVAKLLLWAVFSYVIVLGLIQVSDVLMRFFIERLGGANLFNVTLNPSNIKNIEANYTQFIGARENSLENMESVATNLLMVKITTLTYNAMFIALVLRKIILWFLLIVSPFLALLMPFVFIRNIGWIWIGVFFQWLFYGPLLSIFLTGLTKIWEFGIPYNFDWSRVDKPEGQIFKTATNILYGGPAQTLTAMNSANYVDTYAEYVIALIMLWAVILLPWLLLRIFRDYCCEAFKAQESAVMSLYHKFAGGLPPAPIPPPVGPTGVAKFELPFRGPTTTSQPQAISLAQTAQISRAQTQELLQAMNLSVSSIRDVANFEINSQRQQTAKTTLSQIANPTQISSLADRRKFSTLKQEFTSRAVKGDLQAQRVLTAAEAEKPAMVAGIQRPQVQVAAAAVPKEKVVPLALPVATQILRQELTARANRGDTAAQKVIAQTKGVSEQIVYQTLQQELQTRAKKGDLQAQRVLAQVEGKRVAPVITKPVPPTPVTLEEYEEVKRMWLNHYRSGEVPISETIKTREDWTRQDLAKITNALELLASKKAEEKTKGYDEVAALLPFLLLGGFSEEQTTTYLKAKLEAAKAALEELERAEKIKEEAKKEAEEELVEVAPPATEEKKEELEMATRVDK